MATAGKVDFPTHMKNVHQDWLGTDGAGTLVDTVTSSVVDIINAALATNPYDSLTAYDPATQLTAMDSAIAQFNTLVDALDHTSDWENVVDIAVAKADDGVFGSDTTASDAAAFADILDDQINNIVLPRFQGGMRDVNAVMSSAYVIGEAIIEGMRDRDVAKYTSEQSLKTTFQRNDFILKGAEAMLRDMVTRIDMEKSVAHYTMEANRIRAVSGKEKKDTENVIAVDGAKWDLQIWQYGANLLAAIGGGTAMAGGSSSTSKTQSAIGGALAGASIGGAVGGGWGSVIGGALGGIGGLL